MAEGKQHALSIGITALSTDEMFVYFVINKANLLIPFFFL